MSKRSRRSVFRATGGLVLLLAVAACGPSTPNLSAREIVDRAGERMAAVSGLHFKLDVMNGPMSLGQVGVTGAEGDLVKPDRMQLTTQAVLPGARLDLGVLSIGGKQYMTNPFTRAWMEVPGGLTAVALFDPASGVPSLIRGARDLKKLDVETVEGVRCYVVDGVLDSNEMVAMLGPGVADRTLQARAWFGVDDFLMRRLRLAGPLQAGESPEIVRVLELSRFNQPATINPPA